jgi:hypothetical protein
MEVVRLLQADTAKAAAWRVVHQVDSFGWRALEGSSEEGLLPGMFFKDCAYAIRHDLVATNAANSAATAINSALVGGQPSFEIVKYEWPQTDMFMIQARHRIGIGYRECLIVGGQVAVGEMHVFYKVFEYENPPDLNLLNGF